MISSKEAIILRLLTSSARPLYGLELVAQSDGGLKRGTVYVTLARMESKGFVESSEDSAPRVEGGLPRRLYKATGNGALLLDLWLKSKAIVAPGWSPA